MGEPLKLGAILLMITTLCVGLLGFVNESTLPIIQVGKQKNQEKAVQQLLPDTESIKTVKVTDQSHIDTVFMTYKSNQYTGSVIKVYPQGYGGSIELLVGILPDGQVAGIQVLSHQETPGLGANADQEDFKKQFVGKNTPLSVNKNTPKDDEIMAITGATITSKGIVEGVNEAAEYAKQHQEEWKKGEVQ